MNATLPLTIAPYVAVFGLIGAALTINVIRQRVATGVNAGDGGVAKLAQSIRAQGNFVEQVPLALLLIVFVEIAGQRPLFVHVLAIALILARLASAYALSRSLGPTSLRQMGAGLTTLVTVLAAIAILAAVAGLR